MISSPSKVDYSESPERVLAQRTLSLSTGPNGPRDGASDLCEPRRCSLEGLHQRLRRERLFEIGEVRRGAAPMRDDPISTLSLIAGSAGKAIDREREQRRVTGVTWAVNASRRCFYTSPSSSGSRAMPCPKTSGPHCAQKNIPSWFADSHKRSERQRMNVSVSGRSFTSSP